ncbi:hypothetical protein ARMSODRAFT_966780 [Armillaria solidipes]|uniref:Uncharacterized protein n=1 Tax=Armillaria solidipes TaxID=1076256 RepID=A0A2H3B6S3_9AGAR|nr:hypothetical protein ARMSODRAFT_966780 [Armillaria solidipes]
MAMPAITFIVKLEDVFKRYLPPRRSAVITVPPDATIADLERTIIEIIQLPDCPLVLKADDGLYSYDTTEPASQVQRTSNGRRVVHVYPLPHLRPVSLIGIHEIPFETPLDLVCQVTALFRPSLLRDPPVRFGTPLESRYHMEFYRAASALTDNAVVLSPDFATNPNRDIRGRIDFLLAYKKWGIEITRDGNRLDGGRNLRLENYAQWLEEGDMSQYIFVDYRVTRPVHSHPDIRHLYHVVFDDKYDEYVILKGGDLSVICHGCLPKV